MLLGENMLAKNHIDSLVQNCSNSIANAMGLLQSCTKSKHYAMWSHQEMVDFLHNSYNTHHSSPVRTMYGVFESLKSDLCVKPQTETIMLT